MSSCAPVLLAVTLGLLSAGLGAAQTVDVDTVEDRVDPPFANHGPCGEDGISALPGADGRISLREAMLAADFTPGAQTIRFAAALAGRTIRLAYDDADANSEADPLPLLCHGDTTIDGDIDRDGDADITIDGSLLPRGFVGFDVTSSRNTLRALRLTDFSFGIYLGHSTASIDIVQRDNRILACELVDCSFAIQVVAGNRDPHDPGRIAGTEIASNRIVGSSEQALAIRARTSSSEIADVEIHDNEVVDNGGYGITVFADPDSDGARLSDIVVRDNRIAGNGGAGILVAPLDRVIHARFDRLRIEDNDIANPRSYGTYLAGGVCGGDDNRVDVTFSGNQFRSGSQGLRVEGGAGLGCAGSADRNLVVLALRDNDFQATVGNAIDLLGGAGGAVENRVEAELTANRIGATGSTGLRVLGGAVGAVGNLVTLTATGNLINDSGFLGIGLIGGSSDRSSTARDNRVVAELERNTVRESGFAGIAFIGGSGDRVRNNRVDVALDADSTCGAVTDDLRCSGFQTASTATDASGNLVVAQLRGVEADRVTVDPQSAAGSCSLQQTATRSCACRGDCSTNGQVTVDEIVTLVGIALGSREGGACPEGDLNHDGAITVDEIVAALSDALFGC